MTKVEAVYGGGLYVRRWARPILGGQVRRTSWGAHGWYPDPGNQLFVVRRWAGAKRSVDEYVLRKSSGEYMYLECVHPSERRSVLDVVTDYRVHIRVLDMVYAHMRAEGEGLANVEAVGGSGLRMTWRARDILGGKVRRAGRRVPAWHPRTGEHLFTLCRWKVGVPSIDYYILRRADGAYLYLWCTHYANGKSELDADSYYRVPTDMLEDIEAHVRAKGAEA